MNKVLLCLIFSYLLHGMDFDEVPDAQRRKELVCNLQESYKAMKWWNVDNLVEHTDGLSFRQIYRLIDELLKEDEDKETIDGFVIINE